MKTKIFKAKLKDLKPTENNPRQISKDDFRKLKKSLQEFPEMEELREIVVDEDMRILGGHQRVKALLENGETEATVKQAIGLTDEQKAEFVIKDNVQSGEFDFDELADSWSEYPLDEWGAVADDWNAAAEEITEDEPVEVDESEPAKSELGGVYQLGRHRLMCGDSTKSADWQKLMGEDKADMVFTDPPYGVAIGDKNKTLNAVNGGHSIERNIEGDTMGAEELYGVLVDAMSNVRENCYDDASYYVTSPQGGSLGLMMMMMKDAGLEVRHVLMWVKNVATFSLGRLDYDYQHEPMFYTWTKSHHNYRKGAFRTTIWQVDKPRKCDLHPTMKPIKLIVEALMDSTKKDDIVLDAFGGSGSTLIACEQTGRRARLMELDPKYCDVIRKRYWKYKTGSEEGWEEGTKEEK